MSKIVHYLGKPETISNRFEVTQDMEGSGHVRSVEIHDRKLEERKEVSKIRKLTTT
jgi:hypothetical protein